MRRTTKGPYVAVEDLGQTYKVPVDLRRTTKGPYVAVEDLGQTYKVPVDLGLVYTVQVCQVL
jgi:hypothetical protein